jgi:hypothetical protein
MYPFVMSDRAHPTGRDYFELDADQIKFDKSGDLRGFPGKPYFIRFKGTQRGALPVRTKQGLNFNIFDSDDTPDGEFFTMSHEFKVAKKYGLITVREITGVMVPVETINFSEFIQENMQEKIIGKETKDKPREIFAKLLMNSSYGKFGQNPEHFKDYLFRYPGEELPSDFWELSQDYGDVEIYEKPANAESYYDVATAASVTSAARAVLLDAIQNAKGIIYCDTDSLVCESYNGRIDPFALGAWDMETQGTAAYIAGKKLYALYDGDECVKLASKGVRLTGADIKKLCKGEKFDYFREAPNFKITGEAKFLTRTVKMIDTPQINMF